ncbi:GNAT family N-acetyltransferase [Chitinispirillales bacterium ANBcel5]|uniref:GNAT family N-acetyltransferase n=1 Tax=Cellulosispirillum alkaliphilum TaxID=3039283 RepID=UPI002A53C954|nr:GNAT family N-acetyltransferase [Chitinispirillales bacterium ANBcel5]
MKSLLDVVIETERLALLPIDKSWADDIFREFDHEITKYMYPKPAEKIDETYGFIESSLKELREGTTLQLVITKKDTKEFIGCAGLHKIDSHTPELGIWTKKQSHGNGYGLETITAIIQGAKENMALLENLWVGYGSRCIPKL